MLSYTQREKYKYDKIYNVIGRKIKKKEECYWGI